MENNFLAETYVKMITGTLEENKSPYDWKNSSQLLKHYGWKKVREYEWEHPKRKGEVIFVPGGGGKTVWQHAMLKDKKEHDPESFRGKNLIGGFEFTKTISYGSGVPNLAEYLENLK